MNIDNKSIMFYNKATRSSACYTAPGLTKTNPVEGLTWLDIMYRAREGALNLSVRLAAILTRMSLVGLKFDVFAVKPVGLPESLPRDCASTVRTAGFHLPLPQVRCSTETRVSVLIPAAPTTAGGQVKARDPGAAPRNAVKRAVKISPCAGQSHPRGFVLTSVCGYGEAQLIRKTNVSRKLISPAYARGANRNLLHGPVLKVALNTALGTATAAQGLRAKAKGSAGRNNASAMLLNGRGFGLPGNTGSVVGWSISSSLGPGLSWSSTVSSGTPNLKQLPATQGKTGILPSAGSECFASLKSFGMSGQTTLWKSSGWSYLEWPRAGGMKP